MNNHLRFTSRHEQIGGSIKSDYVFVGHRFAPGFLLDFREAIESAFDAKCEGAPSDLCRTAHLASGGNELLLNFEIIVYVLRETLG